WFRWVLASITCIVFFLGTFINLIDVEYFSFTSARSTNALFTMLGFGSDLVDQLPGFLADFWYILILPLWLLFGAWWLLKTCYNNTDDRPNFSILKQATILILVGGIAVLIGR